MLHLHPLLLHEFRDGNELPQCANSDLKKEYPTNASEQRNPSRRKVQQGFSNAWEVTLFCVDVQEKHVSNYLFYSWALIIYGEFHTDKGIFNEFTNKAVI
jgi:hypothetical protein